MLESGPCTGSQPAIRLTEWPYTHTNHHTDWHFSSETRMVWQNGWSWELLATLCTSYNRLNGKAAQVGDKKEAAQGRWQWHRAHHKVLWLDSKQVPEVTECNRSIGFKSKVTAVMSWCKVAALTEIIIHTHHFNQTTARNGHYAVLVSVCIFVHAYGEHYKTNPNL